MNHPYYNAMPTQPGYITRPVTSREEAVAAQTDVFGLGTLMPDLSHNVIYLKKFNPQTGGSVFQTFMLHDEPRQPDINDVNKAIAQLQGDVRWIKEILNDVQSDYNADAGCERWPEPPANTTSHGSSEPQYRSVRTNDRWQEQRRPQNDGPEYGA